MDREAWRAAGHGVAKSRTWLSDWSNLILSEWSSGFPHFLQYHSEFGNNEFMIWATVSSRSCFCWLYSFSIFACTGYNQCDFDVDHLVMAMCRVFSCVVGWVCLLWLVRYLLISSFEINPLIFDFCLLNYYHLKIQVRKLLLEEISSM